MTTTTTSTTADERPYYLTGPCPAWCRDGSEHRISWAVADRRHRGDDYSIALTAMDAIVDTGLPDEVSYYPRELVALLEQHYRETEPRVHLVHGDDAATELELTLNEASELAELLGKLVAAGRQQTSEPIAS